MTPLLVVGGLYCVGVGAMLVIAAHDYGDWWGWRMWLMATVCTLAWPLGLPLIWFKPRLWLWIGEWAMPPGK